MYTVKKKFSIYKRMKKIVLYILNTIASIIKYNVNEKIKEEKGKLNIRGKGICSCS